MFHKQHHNSSKARDGHNDKRPASPTSAGNSSHESAPKHSPSGFMLWGTHPVTEAWVNPRRRIFRLWLTAEAAERMAPALEQSKTEGLARPNPAIVDRAAISALLPPDAVHQGIAADVAPLPETSLEEFVLRSETPPELLVILDQVSDPHNVGAVLRSASAFGAGAVIMTTDNAPPDSGVLAKAASGALEHVPLIRVTNLARALTCLQKAGYWRVGLDEDGKRSISAPDLSGRLAIVLGAEGTGLRRLTRENCDEIVNLPTGGAVASLNVSNAAAVALYEVKRQVMAGKIAGNP